MKKQFLCTSAIALGVVAAPATAQDWSLDWGGFMRQHVAFNDISSNIDIAGSDFEGLDIYSNTEIIFTPKVTLDNGMTFGINVQFEGEKSGSEVDETYMSISSDTFGKLDIGSENSAGNKMMVSAPGVTSGSASNHIPFSGIEAAATAAGTSILVEPKGRQAGDTASTEVGGNNDVQRITYYTPDFNGLTLGVSYAPEDDGNAGNSGAIDRNDGHIKDIFDIGVNYSQSFGTTDITLAARWGTGNTPSDAEGASDYETWGVGFQVGFSNVTVGGSWAESDNDETDVMNGIGDSEGWSLGVTYNAVGPWSFGIDTYQSESDILAAGAVDGKLDRETYTIGANRDLGPGVSWDVYVASDIRNDDRVAGTEVDAIVVGTGVNLSF